MGLEGRIKINKPTPALIATKAGDGWAKDEIIEVGSKKALKELKEQQDLTNAEIKKIKAVED